jgi:hypothetical protein
MPKMPQAQGQASPTAIVAPSTQLPIGASPDAVALANLQTHIAALERALTVLNAQKQEILAQMRGQSREIRTALTPQLIQVDMQIVQNKADLAASRAELSARSGVPVEPSRGQFPPHLPGRSMLDSDQITGIVIVFILAVLMPLSIGMLRRLWRIAPKDRSTPLQDVISPRLDRLEQAVDAIAVEIERVSEGQRFVTKVLAERPMAAAPAPMSIPVPMAANEAAPSLGEAKLFRALGAGPAEPIRMQERQAVRSSITPH